MLTRHPIVPRAAQVIDWFEIMSKNQSLMQQELLRRRLSNTLSTNVHLIPSNAPYISHHDVQHEPLIHPKASTRKNTNPQLMTDSESPIASVLRTHPHSGVQTNKPHSESSGPRRSPIQEMLLQERAQKIALNSNSPQPLERSVSSFSAKSSSSSPRLSSSDLSVSSVQNVKTPFTRRPPLSPAITNFKAPQTTRYSDPLRRQKVLLVGIGYRTHRFLRPLPGCRNDVRNMFHLLTGPLFEFPKSNIRILCDELDSVDGVEALMPTRSNILKYLRWLTVGISSGDSAVFFFAGHGDFLEDLSGDEVESGFDQVGHVIHKQIYICSHFHKSITLIYPDL